jgi:photosystem II stability/assembly factor-like uncharacterized protein
MAKRVHLLVGTRKGLFIAESGEARDDWALRGPYCDSWIVNHAIQDPHTGAIYAGGVNAWFGSVVWRSDDLGKTWDHSSEGLNYGEGAPEVVAVWSLGAAPGVLYAGVEPAGLFRSNDGGRSWSELDAMRNHPSHDVWMPGGGGLILHTIAVYPDDPDRIWTGISSAGAFYSADAGKTWEPRNRGTRFPGPDEYPEVGQCVHHFEIAADGKTLYQQNHVGMYRSDDDGCTWVDIEAGLPSDFGFPCAVHPRDADTAWFAPLNGAEQGRFMPGGAAAVWRTRDRGASWQDFRKGLPQEHAYLGVFRQAMAADACDPAGVYFGTSTGELFGSNDEGESWQQIASYLPPVTSVETFITGA